MPVRALVNINSVFQTMLLVRLGNCWLPPNNSNPKLLHAGWVER